MKVDESWEAGVCMRVFSTPMPRSNENKSCMRVEKREFAWEFSQLPRPIKREQELHESWWELASESLHESVLNSHAPVKREQELHESWEARVCMRVFSTPTPDQTRTRVAWKLMRVGKREFAWECSQLPCPGQTRTRVAWELNGYYRARSDNSHQLPSKFEPQFQVDESWWKLLLPTY
jgi:hypothetical protein